MLTRWKQEPYFDMLFENNICATALSSSRLQNNCCLLLNIFQKKTNISVLNVKQYERLASTNTVIRTIIDNMTQFGSYVTYVTLLDNAGDEG